MGGNDDAILPFRHEGRICLCERPLAHRGTTVSSSISAANAAKSAKIVRMYLPPRVTSASGEIQMAQRNRAQQTR
jgi:hypothetical protein